VIVVWTSAAWADIDRLHAFLAQHDSNAADATFDRLSHAPEALLHFPRRGAPASEFDRRDVREFRVGAYLLRYEISGETIYVLRFFHGRADRL
jgi:plasmid stabilization system protein ParE